VGVFPSRSEFRDGGVHLFDRHRIAVLGGQLRDGGHAIHNDLKTITIPAPSLTAGHYVLEWSVFTHDSIALSGRIRFTVSAQSSAQ